MLASTCFVQNMLPIDCKRLNIPNDSQGRCKAPAQVLRTQTIPHEIQIYERLCFVIQENHMKLVVAVASATMASSSSKQLSDQRRFFALLSQLSLYRILLVTRHRIASAVFRFSIHHERESHVGHSANNRR